MKKVSNWSNAIAHVDCDAFYASCEQARRPDLRSRPVCVLSSQNAIVVAKSYDAKRFGITTGMPAWEARKIAPQAEYLAADFRYYGQVSDKVFSILRRFSPDIEIYSIDEAFMDMNGIRTLWHKSFAQIADDIRAAIRRETGITASVGVANTRTLAKLASESNKPDGTTVVPGKRIAAFLREFPVAAIPGVGRNRAALLQKFDIHSALQFAHVEDGLMQRLLGRHGMVLKHELNGCSVLGLEIKTPLPKSVARTASMGEISSDRHRIAAHLSWHTVRLVSELVAKHLLAGRLYLFLTLDTFERAGMQITLDVPTNSLKRITAAVKQGFSGLFRAGGRYRGCGVVATHISREASRTHDLFGFSHEDSRQSQLMLTVNEINRKYGARTLLPAAASEIKKRSEQPRFHYPLLVAH